MDNIQEITLDIRDNHTYQQLYTKQYDYGSLIIFHITKNGKPFEIEGAKAVFSMKKPDSHVIENTIDVVDGKIAIDITEQMTSSYGKAKFSITLFKDDISITTITGIMKIEEAVIHPEDIESSDEYNIVVDILNKVIEAESAVNTAIKKVEEASDFADAAKTSATNAENSASTAIEKANEAAESANNAAASADDATNSAITATEKANDANTSAGNAATSADDAANSANLASTKATEASSSANTATIKATEAFNSATNAQNYAIGDTDSSKYYYEQVKTISESLSGALRPIGTITFANLPNLDSVSEGDMYNISDEFTTNENFKEGSGNVIPAGANIYKTTDGYWDVLAGSPVTSVNGQRGNVVIIPSDIGAVEKNGSEMTGTLVMGNLSATSSPHINWLDKFRHVWAGTENEAGDFYLYDATNNKSIIWSPVTGKAYFFGDATNADMLDGYHGSFSPIPYTYVLRDNNGYTKLNYIESITNNDENPNISQIIVTNGSDNYYRKASLSHLKSQMGIGNGTITINQNGVNKGSFTLNQSGNVTINLTDTNTNTWRGIQDNLTSTSTSDSLSANQGRILSQTKVSSYDDGGFQRIASFLKYSDSNNANVQVGGTSYLIPLISSSDERIKENINPTEINALNVINSISHHSFDFKFDEFGKHSNIGYIAQELLDVVPEAVISVPQDKEKFGYPELYQVNYVPLIPYLTKAVQELSEKLENLSNKIDTMRT